MRLGEKRSFDLLATLQRLAFARVRAGRDGSVVIRVANFERVHGAAFDICLGFLPYWGPLQLCGLELRRVDVVTREAALAARLSAMRLGGWVPIHVHADR